MANKYMDSSFLDKAIIFATKAHANTERRGKGFPYIVHPMEAMEIVATMTSDQEMLAAAALHDTVEDTDVTVEQIRAEFGDRVAAMVASESDVFVSGVSEEDSWRDRKKAAIDRLAAAGHDSKVVALGDKLSNMRAIYRDFCKVGDELWKLFHAPGGKADHAWHYRGLADSLRELSDTFAFQEFEKLINERTRGILICNPNNPTGYLYSRKEMNQLRDIVEKHDLFLFSDEVYREFIYTGSPYISAMHLEGIEQNVILIDSVSKRYSETGIRVGSIVTKNAAVRQNIMKFCQARLSPPLLGQIVAEASIDADPEYMLDTYDEYVERRKFLIDGLNRIDGVYSPVPMGAFYTMVKLPVDDAEKFCEWCLTDFSYEGQTVMKAPGAGFYTDAEEGKNQVRMAYVLKKEELAKAMVVLRKALEEYNVISR